jgi:hypothetical protein
MSAAASLLMLVAGCGQMHSSKVISAGDGTLTVTETSFDPMAEETITTYRVAADAEVIIDGEPATLEELQEGDAVSVVTENRDDGPVATKIEAQSTAQVQSPEEPAPQPESPHPLPPQPLPEQPLPEEPLPEEPQPETPLPVEPLPEEPKPEPRPEEPIPAEPIPAEPIPAEPIPAEPAPEVPAPEEPQPLPAEEAAPAEDNRHDGKIVSVADNQIVLMQFDTGTAETFTTADGVMVTLDGKEATMADLMPDLFATVTIERQGDTDVVTRIEATSPK